MNLSKLMERHALRGHFHVCKSYISKVDYYPQKPDFNMEGDLLETHLERRTPESQGVRSAFFTDLI